MIRLNKKSNISATTIIKRKLLKQYVDLFKILKNIRKVRVQIANTHLKSVIRIRNFSIRIFTSVVVWFFSTYAIFIEFCFRRKRYESDKIFRDRRATDQETYQALRNKIFDKMTRLWFWEWCVKKSQNFRKCYRFDRELRKKTCNIIWHFNFCDIIKNIENLSKIAKSI